MHFTSTLVPAIIFLDDFVLQPAAMAALSGKNRRPVCRPPAGSESSPCPTDSVGLHAAKLWSAFAAGAQSLKPSGRCLQLRRVAHALQVVIDHVPMPPSPVLYASPAAPFRSFFAGTPASCPPCAPSRDRSTAVEVPCLRGDGHISVY